MTFSTKISSIMCVMIVIQSIVSSYPMSTDNDANDFLMDSIGNDVPALIKRRMSWGNCDGFFKWRCGKERVVLRGK